MSWGSLAQSVGRILSIESAGRHLIISVQLRKICILGPLPESQSSSFIASQPHSLSLEVLVNVTPNSWKSVAFVLPDSCVLEKRSGGASVA